MSCNSKYNSTPEFISSLVAMVTLTEIRKRERKVIVFLCIRFFCLFFCIEERGTENKAYGRDENMIIREINEKKEREKSYDEIMTFYHVK